MDIFTLRVGEEYIALFQLLKANSMCGTGGEAKIMISEGLVKVNGAVTTVKRLKIRPDDVVEFNGATVGVEIASSSDVEKLD